MLTMRTGGEPMLELNKLFNMDCMEGMKQFPDKYFELAIVDPPYFSGPEKRGYYGRKISPIGVKRHYNRTDNWDIPSEEYFIELARVSKNQIIWGCNYYKYIFSGSGRIVWDKCNGENSFSDVEIAYCSMHDSVRLIRYMWNGMMQGKSISEGWIQQGDKSKNEVRIHPTQKPVKLYKWLLMKYAKSGDKILDTHVGSASSLIAAYQTGYDYVGFEIDTGYFNAAQARLEDEKAQVSMFEQNYI